MNEPFVFRRGCLMLLTMAIFAGCSTKQSPKPLPYPQKAYTLRYQEWQGVNEQGREVTRQFVVSSDGHGCMAFADETGQIIRLDDFRNGKSYSFDKEKRLANWTELKDNEPWELDTALFYLSPSTKSKIPIGDKDINGLHCEGWTVGDRVYWFDKRFGYLMHAQTRVGLNQPYHWLVRTATYNSSAMPDDAFKIPPGYEPQHIEEKRVTLPSI